MRMLIKVYMLAIITVFSLSSLSLGANQQDPHDPRWIEIGPWINPKATYLRTCNDEPDDAVILVLDTFNISIGDWVVIRGMGDFLNTPSSTELQMTSVFSTSTSLLTDEVTRQHRVPGAVFLSDYQTYTLPTWLSCIENPGDDPKRLETNIPEDFKISRLDGSSGALVQVPAPYLFVSSWSRWFSDNIDPDHDYHVEFSDEIKWHQRSETCDFCWNDHYNWDVYKIPTIDVGVTFDQPENTSVINADSEIKYLRIVNGAEVEFGSNTNLFTLIDEPEKYSLLIDGVASLSLTSGQILDNRTFIGYDDWAGQLKVSGGSTFMTNEISTGINAGTKGFVEVSGDGTILNYHVMGIGADLGSGELKIFDGGHVKGRDIGAIGGLIFIGGNCVSNCNFKGRVYVESLGKLSAEWINISTGGMLVIRQGVVDAPLVSVWTGGIITGCHTGIIRGNVIDIGGLLGPGCSTGKLIIDGDYIQETEGTLEIEVGGYNKGEDYDVLEVTGNVTLNGTLQVNFVNGFAPKQGDIFEFTNVTGSVSQNLSKVEINCVSDNFQSKIELVEGKLTMTALNDARAIPCGGPKAMPWIPLLLLD